MTLRTSETTRTAWLTRVLRRALPRAHMMAVQLRLLPALPFGGDAAGRGCPWIKSLNTTKTPRRCRSGFGQRTARDARWRIGTGRPSSRGCLRRTSARTRVRVSIGMRPPCYRRRPRRHLLHRRRTESARAAASALGSKNSEI